MVMFNGFQLFEIGVAVGFGVCFLLYTGIIMISLRDKKKGKNK